jgi:uncharacterized heparinase superfamily protein
MDNKIKLYINTIKYLKSSQIFYRVSNKFKRELYKRKMFSIRIPEKVKINDRFDYLIPELDFNRDYLDRFDLKDILNDRFTFINITNQVDPTKAWNNEDLQHLWRYNLHYFEYFFKLSHEYSKGNEQEIIYEKFKYLIDNWINHNPYAFGDGWHPYTISLRITNWIISYQVFKDRIEADKDFEERFQESIYLQYKYLQTNLEKDVLGNHYFENIKALIIGSIFFDDEKIKGEFKKELLKQLDEQILEDGMHFELSPMYHKIILEDLIKITYWLRNEEIYNRLLTFLQKMINVTHSFEDNFGKTPSFNDSADGISKNHDCLLAVCKKYFIISPQFDSSFEKSGFYIIGNQNKKLIFDTGDICPSYLPAHGHCDGLSFELSSNGLPLIVNSGTYRYENGEWRNFFRSTKAHNTVSISDQEQSQFWGSFRVAQRIKNTKRKQIIYNNIQFQAGSYVTYQGKEHKRFIGELDEKVIILDYVNSKETAKSYLHFVPGTNIEINNNTIHAKKLSESLSIVPIGISNMNINQGWYSDQFNSKEKNEHLVFHKNEDAKVFGYILHFGSSKVELHETENEIRLMQNNETVINYEELGEML